MTTHATIEQALADALPVELRGHAAPLAQALAALLTGGTTPADARARLSDSTLAPALAALAGRTVNVAGQPLVFGIAPVYLGDVGVVQQITVSGGYIERIIGTQITIILAGDIADDAPVAPPVTLPDLFPPAQSTVGRQPQLARLRALWAQVGTLTTHGTIVFLAGRPGHGRRATARAAAAEIRRRGGAVLSARFWPEARLSNTTPLWESDPLADLSAVALEPDVVAAWPNACRLGGPAWPRLAAQAARLIGQMPTPGRLDVSDDPAALVAILRRAAGRHSLLLVLEGFEDAPAPWPTLLRCLAPELTRDLPILVVATVEAADPIVGPPERGDAGSRAFAQALVAEGHAEALWLGPVDASDLVALTGDAERAIIRRLREISDGVPAIAESLWASWVEREVVVRDAHGVWCVAADDAGWVFGEQRDLPQALLAALVNADAPYTRAQAEEILACAALEGPSFTVQAVARTLGLDTRTLLNFLDDYVLEEDDRPGLIAEVGFAPIPGAISAMAPNIYRFAYPYLWQLWRRYGFAAARAAALHRQIAASVELAYYPHTDMVAAKLAELFREAGMPERAEPYLRRTAQAVEVAVRQWEVEVLEQGGQEGYDAWWLFDLRVQLASQFHDLGRYREGYDHAGRALRQARGWQDAHLIALAGSWAGLLALDLGFWSEARPLLEEALAIREQTLGPTHPQTATSLNNLAELFRAVGDYGAARPLYARALAISEQTLGPTHPQTATSLNNLAVNYAYQEQFAVAADLMRCALAIREQRLGPDHPNTQSARQSLAAIEQRLAGTAAPPPSPE